MMYRLQKINAYIPIPMSMYRSHAMFLIMLGFCVVFAFLLSACSNPLTVTNTPTSTIATALPTTTSPVSSTSTTGAGAVATPTGYPVKVYFSKNPVSLNSDPTAVFPVNRVSPTLAVGTFSIQLLIAGPTPDEQKAGYFTELNTILSGSSNCTASIPVGGPDFTLTLDKKGMMPQKGTATLQFCRATNSPGIGADARITAEINATLKQFSTIKNVVILTQSGHCFGDESGKDMCLK